MAAGRGTGCAEAARAWPARGRRSFSRFSAPAAPEQTALSGTPRAPRAPPPFPLTGGHHPGEAGGGGRRGKGGSLLVSNTAQAQLASRRVSPIRGIPDLRRDQRRRPTELAFPPTGSPRLPSGSRSERGNASGAREAGGVTAGAVPAGTTVASHSRHLYPGGAGSKYQMPPSSWPTAASFMNNTSCYLCADIHYNAPVNAEDVPEQAKGQQRFFAFLRRLDYFEIRLGRLEKRPSGAVVEKGVDVRLATDMVAAAFEDRYDTAILISGDGDFADAVQIVKNQGKHVELAYPRCRCLARLLEDACDRCVDLAEPSHLRFL